MWSSLLACGCRPRFITHASWASVVLVHATDVALLSCAQLHDSGTADRPVQKSLVTVGACRLHNATLLPGNAGASDSSSLFYTLYTSVCHVSW